MRTSSNPNRIGIIGKGNVGSSLESGLTKAGYKVRTTGKEPKRVKDVGQWAEAIILAVPYPERLNAINELGDTLEGKLLIDVTNALDKQMSFAGSVQRSGAEELQSKVGDTPVVKAFNTVFAEQMDKGTAAGEPLTLFVAGNDEDAKKTVIGLGEAIGFDALDAGPLENARWLETLGYLNITLAYKTPVGPGGGFRYVLPNKSQRGQRPRTGAKHSRKDIEQSPEHAKTA
jgi:8-hydroxy-5-deazaflavin:NADPH oxidoreductase